VLVLRNLGVAFPEAVGSRLDVIKMFDGKIAVSHVDGIRKVYCTVPYCTTSTTILFIQHTQRRGVRACFDICSNSSGLK
jgi:hypothetical protein